MTHHRSGEPTYGETRSIDRLIAAADTLRSVIMHDVADPKAQSAALALVTQALGVAVQGVATA